MVLCGIALAILAIKNLANADVLLLLLFSSAFFIFIGIICINDRKRKQKMREPHIKMDRKGIEIIGKEIHYWKNMTDIEYHSNNHSSYSRYIRYKHSKNDKIKHITLTDLRIGWSKIIKLIYIYSERSKQKEV
jgi:hypothetical protein